jgi:hypothetical protein
VICSSVESTAGYFKLNVHSVVICSSVESTAGQSLSVVDLSALIEGLVRSDRCGEASKVALGMLEKGICPVHRVLRFLVNRLAVAGDIDTLTAIGNFLTPVSIANYFILALVELWIIYRLFIRSLYNFRTLLQMKFMRYLHQICCIYLVVTKIFITWQLCISHSYSVRIWGSENPHVTRELQ